MVKIFATGTTGYIGGDALFEITKAHPEYEITCLVRTSSKGALVAKQYPAIRLVYGDLDSSSLIAEESTKADIVCNWANCDHEGAAKAIIDGISKKLTETPGYLIHTSGAGILTVTDLDAKTYGVERSKVYDDWDGIGEVTSLKEDAPHRRVDSTVLAAGKSSAEKIKTAIVCPPAIYGRGRGPGNQRSVQVYDLTKTILKRGRGFQIEGGENVWNTVHVQDLSTIFLRLVEDAVRGGVAATWGDQGYYFAENEELAWGKIAQAITEEAYKQGLIETNEVKAVSAETSDELIPHSAYLLGTNSRGKAIRARKLFGWGPEKRSLIYDIPDIVADEAKELGLIQGHAAKAAGQTS